MDYLITPNQEENEIKTLHDLDNPPEIQEKSDADDDSDMEDSDKDE